MKRSDTVQRVKSTLGKKPDKSIRLHDGNTEKMIPTGSTLLDLAICGTRVRGGGIPSGVAVEIFGGKSAGKTVLMCEIAGSVQRNGGDAIFNDPEARLDKEFAKLFDMRITDKTIKEPDTIAEVFECFDNWKPVGKSPHAIIADSIAALCTKEEMESTAGYDGAKRANEFSQGFRRFARLIKHNDYIMVFSNQIRSTMNAKAFAKQTKATGGYAPGFYASIRLEMVRKSFIKKEKTVHGKKQKATIGAITGIYVEKSSVDKGYRDADIYIMNDYGIDDLRANLVFLKQNSKHRKYSIDGDEIFGDSIDDAIEYCEENNLEPDVREAVIDLWEEIQAAFVQERKKKWRAR